MIESDLDDAAKDTGAVWSRSAAQQINHGARIGRYARLWALVADACRLADRATVYDDSSARAPFRVVATYDGGRLVGEAGWPRWTPAALRT